MVVLEDILVDLNRKRIPIFRLEDSFSITSQTL